jgi:RHS repeat-associated protein
VSRYDPLLRRVRVDTPKGFFSRIAFTSWTEVTYDENDTVKESEYYITHIGDPALPPAEREALEKAAVAYNTPSVTVLDNTGVAIRQVESNLGDVSPATLEPVVAGSGVTAQALWAELVAKGYLRTSTVPPAGTWITGLFQPYVPGFRMELAPELQPFAAATTELLRQGVLTTFLAADGAGRTTTSIDPRLYGSNLTQGTDYFSFRWTYGMDGDVAARTRGADAGDRWALANVFGSDLALWDGRPLRVDRAYDRLQRLLETRVTDAEGAVRRTEEVTYGEGQPDAALHNLRGQVWRYRDQAGVELNPDYTFQGQVALTTRQLAADYRGQVDWAGIVPLDPAVHATSYQYDALLRVTAETTPEGSTTQPGYHLSGRLKSLQVTDVDGTVHPYVDDVVYTAASQRTRLDYHNGVVQRSAYEWTTGRLVRLNTVRPAAPERNPVLQDLAYTYDPVGNVTLRVDRTAETVFCHNQQVEARGDYTYDPLYRLVGATGRQHPGIAADTHLTGFKQSLWAYLCPPDTNDQVKLERYEERYTSDDSGNLVALRHAAASASFTRLQPVEPGSNRLQGVACDACGNPMTLSLLNSVGLAWDYRNQLSSTTRIERTDGKNDQDWYVYDHGGRRLRKVVERVEQGGTVTELDDHVYLGTFELRRITRQGTGAPVTVVERQTLRVMDDATCVVIRDTWLQDPLERQASTGEVRERYQLADALGSVAVEVGGSAALLSLEEYFPFGGTAVIAGEAAAEVEAKVYRWAGKECDDSTGLYYYGLRYYAPWLGRWLNPDPTGPSGGPNLYAFAGGNPTSRWDSNGGTPFDITDLTDDEVFQAVVDLRTTIRTGASTTFAFGGTHSTTKVTYQKAIITGFESFSSIIATGETSGFQSVSVSGTGSMGQVLAQWKGTNYEIKAGGSSRYASFTGQADVAFFSEVRRKMTGKDPIAPASKRKASDYFAVISGLAEQQRDTLGGIASFMAVNNACWTGDDAKARSLYKSYYTASKPLLSFAPSGGQKVLTDYRDSGTVDPTFKSNLVSVARTFLGNVKIAKGGATLASQSYATRGNLLQGVRDALNRKFSVAPPPPPPVIPQPIVFAPLVPPTTTTGAGKKGGGGGPMRGTFWTASGERRSARIRHAPY